MTATSESPNPTGQERPDKSHPAYGCRFADTGVDAAFDELERRVLERQPAQPIDLIAVAGHALTDLQVQDLALNAEWLEIDGEHVGALESYECGGQYNAQLVLLERTGDAWRVADRKRFSSDAAGPDDSMPLPSVLHHDGANVTLEAHRSGTQYTTSSLVHLRADGGRWVVLFSREEMIDLEDEMHAGELVLRWEEQGHALGWSNRAPRLRFEVSLPMDASKRVEVPRSLTPWLQAIEDFCQTHSHDGRVPCGPHGVIEEATRTGDRAEVRTSGGDDLACDGEAIGSVIAADRYRVVELRAEREHWRLVSARPVDRGCAMTKKHLTRFSRSSTGSGSILARVTDKSALSDTASDLVWSDDETLVTTTHDSRSRRELRDVPLLLARDGDSVYWYSSETYRVRRLRQGIREDLVEPDMSIAGLAAADGTVYWSVYRDGEIRGYQDGKVRVIASGLDAPMGLAVLDRKILVATASGIISIDPTTGAADPTRFEALAPISVAARDGIVAWVEAGGRVLVSNATKTRVVVDAGHPTQVAIREDRVVWLDIEDRTVRQARLVLK